MPDRYFAESPVASDRVLLAGPEAHHLLHVMRAKAGTRVTLFDGTGWQFEAVVVRAGRSDVELAITGREEIDREAKLAVTLGVALPKGERQKWLVEKLVELGVARLVPLGTERGVAQPVENALERLRRVVIEASKQCGRNRLMPIAEPQPLPDFLAENKTALRLLAHPGQPSSPQTSRSEQETGGWCRSLGDAPGDTGRTGASLRLSHQPPGTADPQVTAESLLATKTVAIAIGPEGGFTDAEVTQAIAQGWQTADLGPRILRVETAAVALAARIVR